ncbi:MAG: hypothetical protein L0323_05140 [Planctomycetes bacterium]|nr:hypothetical protein [Planctomycetota bacterium]
MKILLASSFAGAVGAVLGGALVLVLGPRSTPAPVEGEAWKGLEAQAEEVRSLRTALGDLASRLEAIEMAPASPRAPAPTASPAPAERVAVPAPVAAGDDLRAAVTAVLQEEREAERKRDEIRRSEQRSEQLERRLNRLSESLAMSPDQKEALRRIFLEDEERRREVGDRAARGEVDWTDPTVREEMRGYVESRQQKLQGILTPEQYQKYEESPEGRLSRVFANPGPGGEGLMRLFGDRDRRRQRRSQEEEGSQPPASGNPR